MSCPSQPHYQLAFLHDLCVLGAPSVPSYRNKKADRSLKLVHGDRWQEVVLALLSTSLGLDASVSAQVLGRQWMSIAAHSGSKLDHGS